MVLPLYDDNRDRKIIPYVTYVLIALNVIVFLLPQQLATNDRFTLAYSVVPQEIVTGIDQVEPDRTVRDKEGNTRIEPGLQPTPVSVYLTLFTSMFMHGSIMHIIGNMLFLWIFGDNVEDVLGHIRYVVFYLITGLLASLAHVAVTFSLGRDTMVPCLGASGAISGVLGGYILLHPTRRVTVVMFRFLMEVPAWVAIGIWFAFQLLNSLPMFMGDTATGVAYGAHIGGFVAGLAIMGAFALLHGKDGKRKFLFPW